MTLGPVMAISGSIRSGSLNTALAHHALAAAERHGAEIEFVDLGAFPLPIYDGDLESRDGVPLAARELCERIRESSGLLIASPEYNGGPTPLLKNTIDWITRVEMVAFQGRPVGLMAATPGRKGGRHGLDILSSIFAWMQCEVGETFSLPTATHDLADEDARRLDEWVHAFLRRRSAPDESS